MYDLKKKQTIQFDIIEKMAKALQGKWDTTQAKKHEAIRSPTVLSPERMKNNLSPNNISNTNKNNNNNNENDWQVVQSKMQSITQRETRAK